MCADRKRLLSQAQEGAVGLGNDLLSEAGLGRSEQNGAAARGSDAQAAGGPAKARKTKKHRRLAA